MKGEGAGGPSLLLAPLAPSHTFFIISLLLVIRLFDVSTIEAAVNLLYSKTMISIATGTTVRAAVIENELTPS